MLTITPFAIPAEGTVENAKTSVLESSFDSATTTRIFFVPMSKPTTTIFPPIKQRFLFVFI